MEENQASWSSIGHEFLIQSPFLVILFLFWKKFWEESIYVANSINFFT